ncbi:MAG TPA: hypothetical protein ENH46_01245, partial [Candidatus Pacearchaeota archaeon]|nr:hypothetical protein [Candidatus Pacearchaeota archaeon]
EFSVDTTSPTWENNKTNLTASTPNGNQVYFNITLNDTNPGDYVFSWYNGTDWENNSAVSYTDGQEVSVTKIINIDVGDINWTWYFNDTAGNNNQSDVWSVTLVFDDQTPPLISIVYPSNNTFSSNTGLNVNYTVSDAGVGVDSCWYSNDSMSVNITLASCINITAITWAEGQHNVTVWANDSAGNENSSSITFTIDTIVPAINFTDPTPPNASSQSATSVYVNVSTSDASNHSAFIDWNYTLRGWWNFESVLSNGTVYDNSTHCYDNETEILTNEGWKYFFELDKTEEVATLNQETMELEYQMPLEYQEFDYNNDMYKIILEDGSDLLVSEDHKVYTGEENQVLNNFLKSFVLNISTEDCFLNLGSLDQIAQFNFNASANIGMSLLCVNSLALDSNCLNNFLGIISTKFDNSINASLNCSELSLEYFNISDSFFFNSSVTYSGVDNFIPKTSEFIMINLTGLSLKKDSSILESTTNCIFYQPSFLYRFHTPSLTLSPSLKQSSSVNSEFSSILSNFLSNNALLTFSDKNLRMDSERFSSGSSSICFFNSSGIDKVMFGILTHSNSVYSVKDVQVYKSFGLEDFSLKPIKEVYSEFNNNNEIYFLDSENNPIKVKSITKEKYDGKIYDVDVENDIVLVRRENEKGIWSGNSNHGTLYNHATNTTVTGARGQAIDFDGVDDYVDVGNPSSLQITGNLTISAWIKTTDTSVSRIVSKDDVATNRDYLLQYSVSASEKVRFGIFKSNTFYSSGESTTLVSDGSWHYIVGINNGTDLMIYVDGVLENSASNGGTIDNDAVNLEIGRVGGGDDEYFNGTIDEVMIFNRVLSPEEINASYNAGSYRLFSNFTGLSDGNYNYTAHVIDALGYTNQTEQRIITIDTTYPTWENNKTNLTASTSQGQQVYFNITLNDTNPGYYIFSWYNGTAWENNSATSYTNGQEVSVTKTINIDTGDINWTWYFNDTAGNSNQSDVWSVTLVFDDQTPPSISIVYPSNNTNTTNTLLDVNYTVSDSSLDSCWYSNDTMSINTSLGTSCNNITTITWSEGQHNVTVWANDSNNNEGSDSVTFTIDTTLPVISIVYPQNTTYNVNVSELNYTFTEASPDSCWYSTDGGATNSSRVNCGANFTNAVSNEGSNTWTIYINDTAGNENSTSVTFFKDTIYPGISILYPSNNTNTTNTLLDVNYTYTETSPDSCWWTSDAGATNNSLTDCTTNITGEAWSEGSNTIIVYINDTANNENSSSVTFTIDTQPPYFTNWANQTLSAGQSLNYDINAADDGVGLDSFAINWTSTFSIVSSTGVLTNTSALSVGEYYINVSINDTLGNLNSSILLVNVSAGDTTPPDINFTNPTPSDNTVQSATAVYVNVSTSDASNHSAFIDWNRSLIGWWKFDEYNASGIYDNSTWNNFGTFNGGLSTSDIVTGKRGKGLDFDGIDDYVSVSDDASLDINNFTISMWIYPKDSSPSQTYSYLLVKGEDWLSEWSYAVRFDDGTYSDLEMVLSSSGTSATENLAPISSVISNEWQYITFTFNGSTVVSYYNGIKQSTSLWSNSIYKGTGRVTMGARWDSSVGSSLYHLNGTIDEVMIFSRALSPEEINASYNAGAYRLFNNFTGLAEGNYNYTAHVIDALGYTNQTEQRTVTIDTTPPTWENNKTNLTASTPQGNLVYFNITLNDTNPGTYIFSWYNGTAWENNSATSYTNGQEVQVTKTITADTGDINWTWYFNDSAGNSNQSDVWGVTLTIDNAYVPEINLTAPQNASIISSESVLLNATVTDGDNDNMTVYLFANNNSNGLNFSEGLVYMQYNVPNGTDINYNLTALPVKPSEDSLVGLWHLDNLSEFGECTVRNQADCVYDFSGNGNNGTLGNATSGTDPTFNLTGGKFAGAFEFDGVDDYVGLGRPSSLNDLPTANFTISAWVYVDSSISSWDSIFGCYQASGAFGVPDGWNFRMTTNSSGDRSLVFDAYHTTTSAFFYSSYGVINDNQWHHVVAVWDASSKNATLYVDGSETSYSSRTPGEGTYNTDSGVGNDKEIGRIPHAGGVQFFDGAIDDVAIYNRALNATEILDHYRLKNGKYFWKGNVSDGTYTNQSDVWEFNITGTPSWAVLLSPNLSFGAWWNVTTLPVIDLDAIGNNDSNGKTTYWVNISATNTLVDVYLKASGNLITAGGIDVLGLGNESYAYSSINNTLVNATNVTMTTSYSSIGKSLGDGSVIYLKFFLDVPGGQPAGWYNNTFDIRTVQEGGSP